MPALELMNGLIEALMQLRFPVYSVDPDTCLYSLTGQTVAPEVRLCPETLLFADKKSCRIRGRVLTSQRWEVNLSFNETVLVQETLSRFAADPPVIRAIANVPDRREESWLAHNWRFLPKGVDLSYTPSSSPQGGTKLKISFDVTHA